MPLTVANLVRYVRLRGVAGNPADVLPFVSEDGLYDTIDRTHQPVFVKFFESWCAHCHKMKRGFEAGATFFKNRVHFMEVRCSADAGTKAFCAKAGVSRYPALQLYTGQEVLPFDGSRAVAAYELFFHEHKAAFPQRTLGVMPAFAVDELQLTEAEQALLGHGYPIREEEVGLPDTSLPVITEDINAARRAVVRENAEEAMADATIAGATGGTAPAAKPASKPTKPAAKPASKPSTGDAEEVVVLRAQVSKLEKRMKKLEALVKDLMFERALGED